MRAEIEFKPEFKCQQSEGLTRSVCTHVVYVRSQAQLPDIWYETGLEAILEVELFT
jgi:hypothetical protein